MPKWLVWLLPFIRAPLETAVCKAGEAVQTYLLDYLPKSKIPSEFHDEIVSAVKDAYDIYIKKEIKKLIEEANAKPPEKPKEEVAK